MASVNPYGGGAPHAPGRTTRFACNLTVGLAHLTQGARARLFFRVFLQYSNGKRRSQCLLARAAIVLLCLPGSPREIRIAASYVRLNGNGGGAPAFFDVGALRVGASIAGHFFICAAYHLLVAGPLRARYEHWITLRRVPLRWVEYAFSAGTLSTVTAATSGVRDVGSLLSLYALVVCMMWFGAMVCAPI